jgi:hypothetical protein
MPIRFTYGEVSRILKHLGFQKAAKGSNMFEGVGADGKPHICKVDYHKDRGQVATGTASKIAKSLGFGNVAEMKCYLNEKL